MEIYNKIDSNDNFYFQHKNQGSEQKDKESSREKPQNNNQTNQSYFSINNFKNTNNPFITNNLINAKLNITNKSDLNNLSNFSTVKGYNKDTYAFESVVSRIIKIKDHANIISNDKTIYNKVETTDKIKNAGYIVEEFFKDIQNVFVLL